MLQRLAPALALDYRLYPPYELLSVSWHEGAFGKRGTLAVATGCDWRLFIKVHRQDRTHLAWREASVGLSLAGNFPAPTPLLNTIGLPLSRVEDLLIIVFPLLGGTILAEADPTKANKRALSALASLHKRFQRGNPINYERHLTRYQRSFQHIAPLQRQQYAQDLAFRWRTAEECIAALGSNRELVTLTHGDFLPQNLMIDSRDQLWVCDWERASWGSGISDAFRAAIFHNCGKRLTIADISVPGVVAWMHDYGVQRGLPTMECGNAPLAYLLDQCCDLRRYLDLPRSGSASPSADLLMIEDTLFLSWLQREAPTLSASIQAI